MNVPRAARRLAHAPLHPRRVRDESGAVAVEFALILPILVMLLLGVTTTGLVYSDHLAITNAAREGGRFGSAVNYNTQRHPVGRQRADPGPAGLLQPGLHPDDEPDLCAAGEPRRLPERGRAADRPGIHLQRQRARRTRRWSPAAAAWSRSGSRSPRKIELGVSPSRPSTSPPPQSRSTEGSRDRAPPAEHRRPRRPTARTSAVSPR